jgi:hypothetical protein
VSSGFFRRSYEKIDGAPFEVELVALRPVAPQFQRRHKTRDSSAALRRHGRMLNACSFCRSATKPTVRGIFSQLQRDKTYHCVNAFTASMNQVLPHRQRKSQ